MAATASGEPVTSVGREAGGERRDLLELLRACTCDPGVSETGEIFRWKRTSFYTLDHHGSASSVVHRPRDLGPSWPPEFAVKLSSYVSFSLLERKGEHFRLQ